MESSNCCSAPRGACRQQPSGAPLPQQLFRPASPPGGRKPPIDTAITDPPSWSTSTYSDSADTSPMDLSSLGQHLAHCRHAHGRLFTLHCVAGTLNRFVSARLVTTLVLAALLIGLAALAL